PELVLHPARNGEQCRPAPPQTNKLPTLYQTNCSNSHRVHGHPAGRSKTAPSVMISEVSRSAAACRQTRVCISLTDPPTEISERKSSQYYVTKSGTWRSGSEERCHGRQRPNPSLLSLLSRNDRERLLPRTAVHRR